MYFRFMGLQRSMIHVVFFIMALCKRYILIIVYFLAMDDRRPFENITNMLNYRKRQLHEYFLAIDDRRPFEDITNTLNCRKRQLHEEPVIHDIDDGNFFSCILLINCYYKFRALWL
jgi:hypothetical protein